MDYNFVAKCSHCRIIFDAKKHQPKRCSEDHSICSSCTYSQTGSMRCIICRKVDPYIEDDIEKCQSVFERIELMKTKEKLEDTEWKLTKYQMEVDTCRKEVEQMRVKLDEKKERTDTLTVKCSECGSSDNEANMQICYSCCGVEWGDSGAFDVPDEITSHSAAVCAVCAIRNHMRKGHKVADFYPILACVQYRKHLKELETKREDHLKSTDEVVDEMDELMSTIERGDKEFDKMYDLIRRSKDTDIQNKVAAETQNQMLTFTNFLSELKDILHANSVKCSAIFDKTAKKFEVTNKEDCFEKVTDEFNFV